MANIKIAQLTNQTTLSDTDLVIVETATSTNKMTVGKFKEQLGIQEKWITATLLNGWTVSSWTVEYYKDTIGNVHLKGRMSGGTVTPGTVLMKFGVGYRPSRAIPFSSLTYSSTTDIIPGLFSITTDGDLKIELESKQVIVFDLIFSTN